MLACAVLGRAATPPAGPCESGQRALSFGTGMRSATSGSAGGTSEATGCRRIYWTPSASII